MHTVTEITATIMSRFMSFLLPQSIVEKESLNVFNLPSASCEGYQ